MRLRRGLTRIAISVVTVCALLLLIHPAPSRGLDTNPRSNCEAIADADIEATAARTTPSLTQFPVVVHYMKHRSEGSGPDSAVRGVFPLGKLKAFFAEDGDFNRVWWKKHRQVMFVLVAAETCTYALGSGARIPVASTPLMRDLGMAFNVREMVLAGGRQPFRGLDLYLWAGITGQPAGQVAGFARSAAAMKRPSVWLAADCEQRGGSVCASKFGHEIGHFFGLCHLCALDPVANPETNPGTCRQTCPPEARAGTRLRGCQDPDAPKLMADQDGIGLEPCELTFAVGNATKILTPAVH